MSLSSGLATAQGAAGPDGPGELEAGPPAPGAGSHLRGAFAGPTRIITREELLASGKVSVGEFLQDLPGQGNALNAQHNHGGGGSATVSLRSLGSSRTLVLVNGRRMVAGGGTTTVSSSVDLHAIPSVAVERIEILMDGGSAVYGSDAVAGVVNVVTRRAWSGSEASAFLGQSSRGDGTTVDLSAMTGTSGDRGGMVVGVGYTSTTPAWAGDRGWSKALYPFDYASGRPSATPSGSTAIPAGRIRLDPCAAACTTVACNALCTSVGGTPGAGGALGDYTIDPSLPGGARPYLAADAYNFQSAYYLYTPSQRVSAFASGDARLGSAARAYLEASYVNRQSSQKYAPEPLFIMNFYGVPVSGQSTYNPYGIDIPDLRRRLVEFGGGHRAFTQDFDTFRAVAGLDGTFPEMLGPLKGWSWDASFSYGRTGGTTTTDGTLRVPRIAAAVGPSFQDPVTGAILCGTPANVIFDCVPLDLFHGAGSITADQAASLGFSGTDRSVVQMRVVQLNASGELVRLGSDRPARLAIGAELRSHSGSFQPNTVALSGEASGNNYKGTRGSYDVAEGYAELDVPILGGHRGLELLEATAAGRIFDSSSSGADATYQLGLRYAPVRAVALRGSYGTSYRAPGISDLFLGTSDFFPVMSDPCSTDPRTGTMRVLDPTSGLYAQCNATGLRQGAQPYATANNGDDRTMQRAQSGGNPAVRPETATVLSLGILVEPVRNLSVTVDYYDIRVTGAISTIGPDLIASSCFTADPAPGTAATASRAQRYCDRIHRLPIGFIDYVDDRSANIGGTEVSGIDLAARYQLASPVGGFRFTLDGTYLLTYDTTLSDGSVIHGAGNYDFLLANPRVKLHAGASWSLGGLGASLAMRYVGSYRECEDGFCNATAFGPPHPRSRTVEAWTPIDVVVSYRLPTPYGTTSLLAGVTNLLDARPPYVYNNGTYPSDPSTYDFLGRYLHLRLSHRY